MKIKIIFDTAKEEDFNLHKLYVKAEDMVMAISDIKEMFRSKLKYGDLTDGQYDVVESLSESFYEIISGYGINNID